MVHMGSIWTVHGMIEILDVVDTVTIRHARLTLAGTAPLELGSPRSQRQGSLTAAHAGCLLSLDSCSMSRFSLGRYKDFGTIVCLRGDPPKDVAEESATGAPAIASRLPGRS